jgi:hypothetical protein
MTSGLTGTPTLAQPLIIEITDNGTAQAITWGASFEASTVALCGGGMTVTVGAHTIDDVTAGNWVGKYGSSDYILCAFQNNVPFGPSDVVSTPDLSGYTNSGTVYQWQALDTNVVDPQSDARRVLTDPTGAYRNAGTWYAGGPASFEATITFAKSFGGTLSTYILDYDDGGRSESIEVSSGAASDTYSTPGPPSFVDPGIWTTWPITAANGDTITIAVNGLTGANCVLAGIFLDAAAPANQGNFLPLLMGM